MGWQDELEKLPILMIVLGIGFGIAFVLLGAFQSSVSTSSPAAANDIGYIITAFTTPIQQYLGLIITILFLIIMFVIAIWGMRKAQGGKRGR